ncbi:MAG TPA: PqqD family protein [Anaerolineales bacterium]|nr:PqqD family protein [Anaerolineales bacterium]
MKILGYFSIKRPDVVYETIDGETVIVNLENGVYYSLRNSGVDVWNLVEAGANLDELTDLIAGRYEASPEYIRKVIAELLTAFQQEGLVQVASTRQTISQAPPSPAAGAKLKFDPPIFEKYSDLQELLLLDPIHEVDEEGWPHKAEEDGAESGDQS